VISGGIGRNVGLVSRIEKIAGSKVTLPEEPMIVGAVGAAMFALDRAKKEERRATARIEGAQKPAKGEHMSTQAYEDRRSGWLDFAAILMFSVGFFRIISAIDFFADKHRINDFTGGLFTGHT
jgi:hypothetical protein